jgi:hypothetical protein
MPINLSKEKPSNGPLKVYIGPATLFQRPVNNHTRKFTINTLSKKKFGCVGEGGQYLAKRIAKYCFSN